MRTVVVGVGNEMKGDDGIGIRIAKQLQSDGLQGKDILIIPAEVPENYIQPIINHRPELLILVDASDFRGKPGEIRSIKDDEISKIFTNTHSIPLVLFLEAIKKQSPKVKTIFIGIQPKSNAFGKPLSQEVRDAGRKAGEAIRKIVTGEVNL
jgi:hydrogenase 3 maturation protease